MASNCRAWSIAAQLSGSFAKGAVVIPALYTHLGAAAVAAALVWQLQGARLGTELAEARLEAATQQLATSTAQRAADARVRQAEQAMNTKYQGALNAARDREALLRRDLDQLRAVADGLREQSADAARRLASAPLLPSLSTPLPSESYLKTAAQRMGTWQQSCRARS
ncbi:hypothetical protein ACHFCA_17165 [Delftia tsuruhatensis]